MIRVGVVGRRVALASAGVLVLFGLVLLAVTAVTTMRPPTSRETGTALVGGPFTLTDQDGRTVTDATYRGEPTLVFFGYTHCPDVCPTTLSDMSQMLDALGKTKPVHALFITVDPERDTATVLKDYLGSFDPRISGLTGTPDQVAAAEKAYRVYSKKVPTGDGEYSMDHTAVVYLMDKDGRFVNAFNLQQPPARAAEDLAAYL